jgi:hypothetical protein
MNVFLNNLHKELQHPGIDTSYNTIKNYVEVKGLKQKIELTVEKCKKCQIYKLKRHEEKVSQGEITAKTPFQKNC